MPWPHSKSAGARARLPARFERSLPVQHEKDAAVIDEIAMAYKDVDAVTHAQRDLVEVVHTLKQVICVKG